MSNNTFARSMLALVATIVVFAATFGAILGAIYPVPKYDVATATPLETGIYIIKPMVLFGLLYAVVYTASGRIRKLGISGVWTLFLAVAAMDSLGFLTLWSMTSTGAFRTGGLGPPYLLFFMVAFIAHLAFTPAPPRQSTRALERPLWSVAAIAASISVLLSLKPFVSHLFFLPLIGRPLWYMIGSNYLHYLDTIEKFPIFHMRNSLQLLCVTIFACALSALTWLRSPAEEAEDDGEAPPSRPHLSPDVRGLKPSFGRRA